MFESITESLTTALNGLTRRGVLTEKGIDDGLREVRKALLSADVNVRVVKGFIGKVKERAIDHDNVEQFGLSPDRFPPSMMETYEELCGRGAENDSVRLPVLSVP